MWKNYLKVAVRNAFKYPLYTAINLLGLSTALVSFLFIALYINDELSFDRYHTDSDRVYRLWEVLDFDGAGERSSSMQFPVTPALLNDYPHLIEDAVRFFNFQRPVFTMQVNDLKFNEEMIFFADSGVFNLFKWPLIKGDSSSMGKPNSIILDKDLARKYFGEEDPLGKSVLIEGGIQLTVTGVMEKVPAQSHFRPRALISFITLRSMMGNPIAGNNWVWNPCWTYLKIKENVSIRDLTSQFPEFVKKYYPEFMAGQTSFYLMPITDIHLNSHLDYEIEPNHQISHLYILGILGLIIVLIAATNFTNLSIARSSKRSMEVGLRKVMGASRTTIAQQFLIESVLMVLVAVIFSILLVLLLLPSFNQLALKELTFGQLAQVELVLFFILSALLLGLLSGFYPAIMISRLQPAKAIKGGRKIQSNKTFRQFLIIAQFTLSIALMIGTVTVNEQFKFLQVKDLGFNEADIVVMTTKQSILQQFQSFRTEVINHHTVENFTVMNDVLGEDHNVFEYNYEGMQADKWQYLPTLIVDERFVSTMGLKVIAGRDFNENIKSDDTSAVLVNETLVREMDWGTPQEALGKRMTTPRGNEHVVGVIEDFHYVPLSEPIRPFVLDMIKTEGFWIQEFAVRLTPGKTKEGIAHLESVWNKFGPQYPFSYYFLEDHLNSLYDEQNTLRILVALFSLIAMVISCFGLFALASLAVEYRMKEMGIRKIVGASSSVIYRLFTLEFIRLISIAILLAVPIAYLVLSAWLNSFSYSTSFNWLSVGLAVLCAVVVSIIAVSYHAIKITRVDPVRVIKSE